MENMEELLKELERLKNVELEYNKTKEFLKSVGMLGEKVEETFTVTYDYLYEELDEETGFTLVKVGKYIKRGLTKDEIDTLYQDKDKWLNFKIINDKDWKEDEVNEDHNVY